MDFGGYRLIQLLGHRHNGINSVAYSPDGARIAGGASDSLILVWDANSGELLRTLEGHGGGVTSLAFSRDGRWLVSGSYDCTLRLWDAENGRPLRTVEGHVDAVTGLALGPDGRWLVSASWDRTVRLWDLRNGKPLRAIERNDSPVRSVAVSPDGRWLASMSLHEVRLWEAESGRPVRTFEGRNLFARTLAFSPDGRWLAGGSNDGVQLWEVGTGKPVRMPEHHKDHVNSLAFSPDGLLASGSGDGTVRLWRPGTGEPLHTLEGHKRAVFGLVFSPDGRRLASASMDRTVRVWKSESGKLARTLTVPHDCVVSLAMSPNQRSLASGSAEGRVDLWEAASGKPLRTLEGRAISLAFSPDGQWLASGSDDGRVGVWDAVSGELVRTLEGHEGPVGTLAFGSAGDMLASGSYGGSVWLWRPQTGRPLGRMPIGRGSAGGWGWVTCLAIHPGGLWLAAGTGDGMVQLWDAKSGGPLRALRGHEDAVGSMVLSPDGRHLATGSRDRTIRIWGAETGRPLHTLEGHEDGVTSLAFSPDGRWLASASDQGFVRLWDAETGDLLEVHRRHPATLWDRGLAFVSKPMAAEPFADGTIWLRTLDESTLHDAPSAAKPALTTITSAKAVLLGESSVGKTALALRLAEDRYEEQATTHGMRIWKLPPERLDPASAAPPGERRELVLWDLGGQDEYRLIHQLFIHDTELALMLFDPTRGKGELDDVREWNARLEAQRRGRTTAKLLVGSKLDGGDDAVDRAAVDRLMEDCQADCFLPTSAKTAFGIDGLRQALAERIDWSLLAQTRRPALFQRIRDEIDQLRAQDEVTLPIADLRAVVERADPGDYSERAVDQVVDQLARQGAIADTRLASGERMLVLQIGEIERYAGSLIFAAKQNQRTRGVPVLDEAEIAQPDFEIPRIPRAQRLLPSRERVVLECVVELLIERGICLRQPGLLIFPSLFPAGGEGPLEGADSISLYYDFTGPIDNLYAALVARAAMAGRFGRVRVSAGRAELEHPEHGLCGVRLKAQHSGRGHLDIFFSARTEPGTRGLFRGFVEDFLRENGVAVTEAVEIRCAQCGYLFAEADVRSAIEEDRAAIFCPKGHDTPIGDALMVRPRGTDREERHALLALKTDIERRLERSAEEAKRAMGRIRIFVSYAHADDGLRAELSRHLSVLRNEGIVEVWDDREIGPGADWSAAIDARLDEAQVVVLLVSADFLASRYCRLETERALKRESKGEATVIPVVLRPVDWGRSELSRLQALPRGGRPITDWPNRDAAFVDVAQSLRRTVDGLLRTPTPQEAEASAAAGEVTFAEPRPNLRILHLSDLHFDAEADPVQLYYPLQQDVREPDGDLGFSKLDYLVISGDLTQRAHPREFERVHRFLDHLFEAFGLSPERCLIVPGNHDLSWEADVYDWRPARKVDLEALPEGSWVKQGDGYLLRRDDDYGTRFEGFARFYKERMQKDYPLDPSEQGMVVLSERDRIQLIGLNSAWQEDEWFQGRAGIHAGALTRALVTAQEQVHSAETDGRLLAGANLLRIAVWHHPPTGNEKMVEDAYLDRLRQANVRLCLHGHVHEDRADVVRYTDPRRVYVAGAGSFGAVGAERPESTPRLYNLLEIPPDRSRVRVHTRCMRKDGGAWEAWAVWPGEGKGERRTFYDIPLGANGVDQGQ